MPIATRVVTLVALLAILCAPAVAAEAGPQQPEAGPAEVIARIQVHGNNATPDAEVLTLAGVTVGEAFTATTLTEVKARLKASGRFEDVDVLKRYASITDLSQVALVIMINEHAVSVTAPEQAGEGPRIRRRGWNRHLMFLPVIDAEDGYGVTFGARVAYVDPIGPSSRLSFPLTWGGTKVAGAELERSFTRGPIDRVLVGASIGERRNPAYGVDDGRRRMWTRVERADGPVRVGGTIGAEHVSFGGDEASLRTLGVDATLDTRLDPAFPRNAVYARASLTRTDVDGSAVVQGRVDARGYLGVIGASVLVGRVSLESSDGPLPRYLRPMLGGWSSLRGFPAGAFTGDTVMSGSAEWRMPLSSPVRIARLGLSLFVDAGRASDHGEPWDSQPVRVGAGGGVWVTATVLRLGVSVARGRDADTRVNFGFSLGF